MTDTNDCRHVVTLLPLLAAGLLTETEEALVRRHGARCACCRARAAEAAGLGEALTSDGAGLRGAGAADTRAIERVTERLAGAMAPRPDSRRSAPEVVPLGAGLGAAAAMSAGTIALAWFLLRRLEAAAPVREAALGLGGSAWSLLLAYLLLAAVVVPPILMTVSTSENCEARES